MHDEKIRRLAAAVKYRGFWWRMHDRVDRFVWSHRGFGQTRIAELLLFWSHRRWLKAADRWYTKHHPS